MAVGRGGTSGHHQCGGPACGDDGAAGRHWHLQGLGGLAFGAGYTCDTRLRFNIAILGVPDQNDYGAVAGWTVN